MVKGQKDMLKNKSFYLWMLSGALVIVCICAVCLNIGDLNPNKKSPKLNDPISKDMVDNQNKPEVTASPDDKEVAGKAVKDDVNLLERDIVDEQKLVTTKPETSKAPEAKAVMSSGKSVLNSLKFDEEKGLAWPVSGNVLLPYSEDKAIHFPTLDLYKRNSSIVIGAEEGTKVVSAAKGVVTKIYENEETGLTLEMSIGNDYNLTYGQLKDLTVKKGDVVSEGQTIGKIAKPSKYYVVEGSNLYFKVTQNEKSVNPMYLLK